MVHQAVLQPVVAYDLDRWYMLGLEDCYAQQVLEASIKRVDAAEYPKAPQSCNALYCTLGA